MSDVKLEATPSIARGDTLAAPAFHEADKLKTFDVVLAKRQRVRFGRRRSPREGDLQRPKGGRHWSRHRVGTPGAWLTSASVHGTTSRTARPSRPGCVQGKCSSASVAHTSAKSPSLTLTLSASGDIYVFETADAARLLPELVPFICQTDSFFDYAVGTFPAGSLLPAN